MWLPFVPCFRRDAADCRAALVRNLPRRRSFFRRVIEIPRAVWFAGHMNAAQALRVARQIVRDLFARESLGEAPPPVSHAAAKARPSLARLLFAPEPLPLDPEVAPPTRRATFVRALFAPEALPEEPPPAPRPPRPGWLRSLFAPESLDPPP